MNFLGSHLMFVVALILGCSILTIRAYTEESFDQDDNEAIMGNSGDSLVGRSRRSSARIMHVKRDTSQNNNSKKLVCYYNNQGAMRTRKGLFTVEMIDPFLCTHLIYLALGLDERGQIKSFIPRVDFEAKKGQNMLNRFVNLKKSNPALKTMLAVEGNSEKYSAMTSSPELRANFVKSAMDYMDKYKLDGLDMIWKYPNDPRGKTEDKENFVALVAELKRAFKPKGYLLSAALPVGTRRIEAGVDVPEMSRQLDFINLMTYDYNGGWDNETGLHAPLFESAKHDRSAGEKELNVAWSVRHWLEKGANPKKLMLGVTTYGRTFTLEDAKTNGMNAPVKGPGKPGPYTKNDRLLGYNEICEAMTQDAGAWQVFRDADYKAPYAVKDDQWVGYEDADSAKLKAQYAMSQGLGGVTITSLCMDDFSGECADSSSAYPITKAVKTEMDAFVRKRPPQPEERSGAFSDEVPRPPTSGAGEPADDGFGEILAPVVSPTATAGYEGEEEASSVASAAPSGAGVPAGVPACGTDDLWWFPGPTCKQYYDCTSGDAILKQCRPGLVWKQSRLWCDYPINVPECPN